MKHHFYLLITAQLLITTTSCYTMERRNIIKSEILAELTTIPNPIQTIFLSNDRVVINGISGCSLFDLITKKEFPISTKDVSAYDPISWPQLTVHPHKKKLAFAHDQTIKIYSTKTGAEKFSMSTNDPSKIVASLTFNPSDDTIFACYKNSCIIERYNYKNNTFHNSIFAYGKSYAPTIAFSPTEKRLCIAPNPGSISIRSFDNYPAEFFSGEKTYHSFCEYSQDGSTIAFGNENNMYILDTHSGKRTQLHTSELITHITFYPNSSILATLSLPYSKVCFWDTKTFLPIISALTPYYTKIKAALKQDFSFSPDGEKLIIALADKCVILPVPFEVIRHRDTKEKI